MTRAYIVLARNDLEDSLLQVLDLKPNATPSKGLRVYEGVAQGGYQSHYLLDGVNNTVGALALPNGPAAITYGLSGYFLDTVEVAGTNRAITAVMANFMAGDIETQVAAGGVLTAAWVNARLVVRCGAATALSEGNGTAALEEILRILAGERYRVPANAVLEDGVPVFIGARRGAFVTAPVIEMDDSVRTTYTWREGAVVTTDTAAPVRGRKSTSPMTHIRPGEPRVAPVQTGVRDTNFQDVRRTVETGDLHLSATDGVLAELLSATFTFLNPAFTYAGGVTPAQTIGAVNIPATGIARAVVVYDVLGNVI